MSDKQALQRRVTAQLIQLARLYRRFLDQRLAGLPLSHSSALAVMVLGRLEDGTRQGALAELMGLEGPTIVPMLDRMERAGLVERRVDPDDKRARTLHLTDTGRDLARQAEQRSDEVRSAIFADIDPADLATTVAVLERIQAVIAAADERI